MVTSPTPNHEKYDKKMDKPRKNKYLQWNKKVL